MIDEGATCRIECTYLNGDRRLEVLPAYIAMNLCGLLPVPLNTDLSFLSFLELYGTEIAERRMPARRVVEALDVVEHI